MANRCQVCGCELDPDGPIECACGGERSLERTLHQGVSERLVRAWLKIGTGGLMLFTSMAFLAGNPLHPASTTLIVTAVGAFLGLRGAAVVKQSRRELMAGAANRALPPARLR